MEKGSLSLELNGMRVGYVLLLQHSNRFNAERQLWAVRVERPNRLHFNSFCNCQSIFEFHTQIPDSAIHLGMS